MWSHQSNKKWGARRETGEEGRGRERRKKKRKSALPRDQQTGQENWNLKSVQLLSCVWLFATLWTAARRPPCPSPTPRAYSNSCPLSQWCHPTISSSVIPFSCLQSFPASGSFPMSWLFASGGENIGASSSVLPVNIQGWFPLGLTCLISLLSKGLSSLLQHHSSKASIFQCSAFFMVQLTSVQDYWKNHNFDYLDVCWQSDVSAF